MCCPKTHRSIPDIRLATVQEENLEIEDLNSLIYNFIEGLSEQEFYYLYSVVLLLYYPF